MMAKTLNTNDGQEQAGDIQNENKYLSRVYRMRRESESRREMKMIQRAARGVFSNIPKCRHFSLMSDITFNSTLTAIKVTNVKLR